MPPIIAYELQPLARSYKPLFTIVPKVVLRTSP